MLKYFFLVVAIVWTGLILFVCLIKSSSVPTVNIVGIDKVVHFAMHLTFTFLWGMAFLKGSFFPKVSGALIAAFLLSLCFGLLIEGAQAFFTSTRSADSTDVLANFLGSLLALAILNSYSKTNENNK